MFKTIIKVQNVAIGIRDIVNKYGVTYG